MFFTCLKKGTLDNTAALSQSAFLVTAPFVRNLICQMNTIKSAFVAVFLSCVYSCKGLPLCPMARPTDCVQYCRYVVYLESMAWSTNGRHKFSCGSVIISNKMGYYEFFTRALQPGVHYVEVDPDNLCDDLVNKVGFCVCISTHSIACFCQGQGQVSPTSWLS